MQERILRLVEVVLHVAVLLLQLVGDPPVDSVYQRLLLVVLLVERRCRHHPRLGRQRSRRCHRTSRRPH